VSGRKPGAGREKAGTGLSALRAVRRMRRALRCRQAGYDDLVAREP